MDATDNKANPDQHQVFAPKDPILLLPEHNDQILESIDFNAYGTSDEDLQF
ncbi:hypothetical protein FLLO111716_02165 [Flavobacterium longum]|uniref:hypothetical protein n=1 Tax=Flavobacterium longum TaxID=1299340 RepID=UPI0039EC6C15